MGSIVEFPSNGSTGAGYFAPAAGGGPGVVVGQGEVDVRQGHLDLAHQVGGARGHQRQRHVLQLADEHLRQEDVHVAVDETRHQRAPAAVDHGGVGEGGRDKGP